VKDWELVHIDDLDEIPVAGIVWRPIRRRLGVRAFGVNAYTAEQAGTEIIEEHDEKGSGAGGHEELYVVLRGRARFTIDGESQDAPAGTIVFLRDPALKRVAVAEEDGTVVLAVGGEPNRAFQVSPWECYFAAVPLLEAQRWDEAVATIEEGLRENPDNPAILYNLACAEARAGRIADAVNHLEAAIGADEKYRELARRDKDFDAIRVARGETFGFPP
jgi:tetratricopeptide (TPR) repeat protein